jgi:hypothetical protein
MRLNQDEQRTSWVANARQQSGSGNVEWPELDGSASGDELRSRGFEVVDLK